MKHGWKKDTNYQLRILTFGWSLKYWCSAFVSRKWSMVSLDISLFPLTSIQATPLRYKCSRFCSFLKLWGRLVMQHPLILSSFSLVRFPISVGKLYSMRSVRWRVSSLSNWHMKSGMEYICKFLMRLSLVRFWHSTNSFGKLVSRFLSKLQTMPIIKSLILC